VDELITYAMNPIVSPSRPSPTFCLIHQAALSIARASDLNVMDVHVYSEDPLTGKGTVAHMLSGILMAASSMNSGRATGCSTGLANVIGMTVIVRGDYRGARG